MVLLSVRSSLLRGGGGDLQMKKAFDKLRTDKGRLSQTDSKDDCKPRGKPAARHLQQTISSAMNWCTDRIFIPHMTVKMLKFMFQNATTDTVGFVGNERTVKNTLGLRIGSVDKGTCHQGGWPEFAPRAPPGQRSHPCRLSSDLHRPVMAHVALVAMDTHTQNTDV